MSSYGHFLTVNFRFGLLSNFDMKNEENFPNFLDLKFPISNFPTLGWRIEIPNIKNAVDRPILGQKGEGGGVYSWCDVFTFF